MRINIKNHGFLRVAAAVPKLKVVDPDYNTNEILALLKKAQANFASIVVFPELGLCGYTAADLYFHKLLQSKVLENLEKLVVVSKKIKPLFVVGLPLALEGKIFNVASVIHGGRILGIVPKTYIPGYKEFYEERWFASSKDLISNELELFGQAVPLGADILFRINDFNGAVLGVEICEDLWVPLPPSSFQTLAGATIIANLSASNETAGKADYRRSLVGQQSARTVSAYIYSSCGVHESTTDLVFGGHAIIAENGSILKESSRFQREGELVVSDLDIEYLISDREKMTSFASLDNSPDKKNFRIVGVNLDQSPVTGLARHIEANPFIPSALADRNRRAKEIFSIQVSALAKRLDASAIKKIVLGLSGGLDSTSALLVSVKTADLLGLSRKNIYAYTMPCFGTSSRTNRNAKTLANALGVNIEEIDINTGVMQQLKDIGHGLEKNNHVVYENAQARYRTLTLLDKANQIKGLVVGTGDLSEIALGWNTYNGDHIANYNVNCSIPKTLIKYLVRWVADTQVDKKTAEVLKDILNTPISPELKKAKGRGISQKTEDLIGPYELHDFFLYHFLRRSSSPKKILFLAGAAWGNKYSQRDLKKWLKVFIERFFKSQWKRSVATDGPKVGSVSLSPRGDWRMPSDAEVDLWLGDLNEN